MTVHRYDTAGMAGDVARGGGGLTALGSALILLPMHPIVGWIFAALALVFAVHLARTLIRLRTVYIVDERGIVARGPFPRRMEWARLTGFRLRYFSTRRDRRQGWMELTLKGDGGSIHLESTLADFEAVVGAAHAAALDGGVAIDQTTDVNLLSLGVLQPSGGLAERWGVAPPGRPS
jgi:hypothetical protein